MTAYGAVDSAIESIRRGAYHYLTKPFRMDELRIFLDRALAESRLRREAVSLRRELGERLSPFGFIAASGAMSEVCELVDRVADTTAPVLLLGETGTGKGMLARALHAASRSGERALRDRQLHGAAGTSARKRALRTRQGAFTGASANRQGLFEEASGGTLFLDEVGELGAPLQAKLLDVLERHVVRAVGANKERHVDVRVVAATHQDLRARVGTGMFREDLLYRLGGRHDRAATAPAPNRRHPGPRRAFFSGRSPGEESRSRASSGSRRRRWCDFSPMRWPGNVRELEHVVERAVLLARAADVEPADLPPTVGPPSETTADFGTRVIPLREMQRRYVVWAYGQLGNRKLLTAETLGIDDKTLAKWLARESET